jgi:hypothetical protein
MKRGVVIGTCSWKMYRWERVQDGADRNELAQLAEVPAEQGAKASSSHEADLVGLAVRIGPDHLGQMQPHLGKAEPVVRATDSTLAEVHSPDGLDHVHESAEQRASLGWPRPGRGLEDAHHLIGAAFQEVVEDAGCGAGEGGSDPAATQAVAGHLVLVRDVPVAGPVHALEHDTATSWGLLELHPYDLAPEAQLVLIVLEVDLVLVGSTLKPLRRKQALKLGVWHLSPLVSEPRRAPHRDQALRW